MAQVEAQLAAIKSIRYNAERTVRSATGSGTEEWSFCYSEPASLRIECRKPVERILVCDGNVFWEYVPSARKAVKTDLSEMTGDSKGQFLSGIVSRVSIEGIRLGDCDGMARRTVSFARSSPTGAVARIVGASPRYIVEIDTEKHVLARTEVFDARGEMVARRQGGLPTALRAVPQSSALRRRSGRPHVSGSARAPFYTPATPAQYRAFCALPVSPR
jgi:outer membrane lipoprotein-sorting protein